MPLRRVDDDDDVMALDEWLAHVRNGLFNQYDGSGRWLDAERNNLTGALFDDVFAAPPPGAAYVAWFNK